MQGIGFGATIFELKAKLKSPLEYLHPNVILYTTFL
jgi:hypothetical protein